jgi:hypothetical protein
VQNLPETGLSLDAGHAVISQGDAQSIAQRAVRL